VPRKALEIAVAENATALYFGPLLAGSSQEDTYRELTANPDAKAVQRAGEGMPDYKILAATLRQRTIAGLPALSCVADFTTGGQPMAEYVVWIRGEKAIALFFGRTAAGAFDAFRESFDRVIETAKIP